ncbi:MAG: response regulator [Gammaproteobacteria bacterium]|nr:response regulator [Gammaproteobacteria bacterium]
MRILITDDNVDLADSLAIILADEDHEVDVAHDVQSSIIKIMNNTYDIILLDGKLPDGNGFDVFIEHKQHQRHGKVIIMTAYRMEQILEYLFKPGQIVITHNPDTIFEGCPDSESFSHIIICNDTNSLIRNSSTLFSPADVLIENNNLNQAYPEITHIILNTNKTIMEDILLIYQLHITHNINRFTILIQRENDKSPLRDFEICGCILKPFSPDEVIGVIDSLRNEIQS